MIEVDANIALNPQQQSAYDAMVRGENVAIFGDAGTGKSVVVKKFLKYSALFGNTICLTPTGLAARNIGEAQTIHSFFNLNPGWVCGQKFIPDPRVMAILQYVKTIIIDEISMVRCDIFDLVEEYLRHGSSDHCEHPFGGKQIIVVGDFKQLSPIVSDELVKEQLEMRYQSLYAFDSGAWPKANFQYYYLQEVFRQNDHCYINILNSIRNNRNLQSAIATCNSRCIHVDNYDFLLNSPTLALCTTRRLASEINSQTSSMLPGDYYSCQAIVTGDFPKDDYPTDYSLHLKVGMKVMVLANRRTQSHTFIDNNQYEYVNGDMGRILGYDQIHGGIVVQLTTGKIINLQKYCWQYYNVGNGEKWRNFNGL